MVFIDHHGNYLGSSFILIKKSLIAFTPFEIGAFRVGLAGLILSYLGIPALRKMSKRDAVWVGVAGFFGNFTDVFISDCTNSSQ